MLAVDLAFGVLGVIAVAVLAALYIEARVANRHAEQQREIAIGRLGELQSEIKTLAEKAPTDEQLCALVQAALVQVRAMAEAHASDSAKKTAAAIVARLDAREAAASSGDRISSTAPPPSTASETRGPARPAPVPERIVPPAPAPRSPGPLPKVVAPPPRPTRASRPPSPVDLRGPLGPSDPTPVSRIEMGEGRSS